MARKRGQKKNKVLIDTLKISVVGIFSIFIIFFFGTRLVETIANSSIFRVKEVSRAPSLQFVESRHLNRLRGVSIFKINLKALQKRLQAQYPEIDQLRIVRRFPDKLYITAKKRDPVAVLSIDEKDVLLDEEGVVLPVNGSEGQRLPFILGTEVYSRVVLGKPLRSKRVFTALKIIKAVRAEPAFAGHRIATVDVQSLSKIILMFNDDIKVIMDIDDIVHDVGQLAIIVSQGNLDLRHYDYVDLRFKEPILGQK